MFNGPLFIQQVTLFN